MTGENQMEFPHKANMKHLKQFKYGIALFSEGVSCPTEDNEVADGWRCAEEMQRVKSKHLNYPRAIRLHQ